MQYVYIYIYIIIVRLTVFEALRDDRIKSILFEFRRCVETPRFVRRNEFSTACVYKRHETEAKTKFMAQFLFTFRVNS